jgi:hypothetical protein
MRFERFSLPEGAVEAFKLLVSEVPRSRVEKMFYRMQKAIDVKREYF